MRKPADVRAKKKRRPSLALACAGALLAAALAAPVRAEETARSGMGPPQSCWTPQMLQGSPDEKAPRKGVRTFDPPPPSDELAASVAPGPIGAIRRVKLKGDAKLVALTFDLCEQTGEIAGYDGAVFDFLRAEGIRATLFAGGKWLRSHEDRARQLLADPQFEVGNHAEAHRNLRRLTGENLTNEVLGPQRSYAAVRATLASLQCFPKDAMSRIPALPKLFRFPYGACNAAALAAVSNAGLTAIQWDVSSGDPDPHATPQAIAETILRHARPGSIIVGHANGRGWHTAEALKLAVPRLRAKGFKFVTVSELLAAGEPVIEQRCYDSKPGDTDRYDFLLASRTRPAAGKTPPSASSSGTPGPFANPWSTTFHP